MFRKLKQKLKSNKLIQKILSFFTIFVVLCSLLVIPSSAYSPADYQPVLITTGNLWGSTSLYFIGDPDFYIQPDVTVLPSDYSESSTIFTYSVDEEEVPCLKLVIRCWFKSLSLDGSSYSGNKSLAVASQNPVFVYTPLDFSFDFVGDQVDSGVDYYHCFLIPVVSFFEPPTVFSVWTHVYNSLISLISSSQVVFFDVNSGSFTLLGSLAVLGLSFGLAFLLIGLIIRFLRLRG